MAKRNLYLIGKKRTPIVKTDKHWLCSKALCILLILLVSISGQSNAQSSRTSAIWAGASPYQDSLWTFNLADYSIQDRLSPTLPGFTITGITGMTTHPFTKEHYCIMKVSGVSGRVLGKINIHTGVCTQIGNLGDNFSSLTFNANGTLFGATGAGASVPKTVYRISTDDASTTLFRSIAGGSDGDVLSYCPDNNYFYNWQGNGTVVWRRFDTTGVDVIETLTYTGTTNGETFGALYIGNGQFLRTDISSNVEIWDTLGNIGSVLGSTLPDDIRGPVTESCTSSISAGGPTTVCSGSSVLLSVSNASGGYQWYMDGAQISGATNVTYSATVTGLYNCIYTDTLNITDSVATGIAVIVNPAPTASITPSSGTLCLGSAATYTVSPLSSTTTLLSQDFNSGLTGAVGGTWTIVNTTGNAASQFHIVSSPGDFGTVGDGTNMMQTDAQAAAGNTETEFRSPTFSSVGYSALSLSFNQYLITFPPDVAVAVDYSLNGGASWTTMIDQLSVISSGSGIWNAASPEVSVALPAGALGQPNVMLRWYYNASQFYWFVDNIVLTATSTPSYTWTGAAGLSCTTCATPTITPTVTGANVYTVNVTANGCSNSTSLTITVNPVPNVNSIANQAVCNGDPLAVSFTGSVTPTTYTWTNSNSSIGLASSGTGDITSFTAVNAGSVAVTATVTVTPSTSTCTGTAASFIITVNPTPDVATVANQMVCNNTMTTAVHFTGSVSGTTFTWTNINDNIGEGGGGIGDIAAFTATNTSSSIMYADIIVTPATATCTGLPGEFTMTVYPTPNVDPTSDQEVCNNNYTSDVYFSGVVFGTQYDWTNSNSTIGIANSGTSNIYSFSATNTTSAPDTATIIVTPSANGCSGTPDTFIIAVNPTPVMTAISGQILCNNSATTDINFSSAVSGTTYTWTNSNTSIGLTNSGTTDILSFTAVNTGTITTTAEIVVTPTANGCMGTPQTINITVNPQPSFTPVAIPAVCQGAATATLSFTGLTGVSLIPTGPTAIFAYTGSVQAYTVAPGVTSIWVNMTGASGGDYPGEGVGGAGGRVKCNVAVTPGDVYYIYLGQRGEDGACCGGPIPQGGLNSGGGADGGSGSNSDGGAAGGAASDIRLSTPAMAGSVAASLATRIVVAGGGGGGSYDCGEAGGAGGDIAGGNGNDCGTPWSPSNGGDQISGGMAQGTGSTAGDFGFGGNASPNDYGSGGGGGWYGGGGCENGSGGGGSSYPAADGGMVSILMHTQGYNAAGNGYASITPLTSSYSYSIVWSSSAITAGFNNVTSAALTSSPANIDVPVAAPAAVYTGTLTLSNGSCTTDYPVSVTINATPDVNTVTDTAVCNNVATSVIPFSGSVGGTTYTWTNSDGSIGLATSGSGDIASFTATNVTSASNTATITVTPSTSFCTGASTSFMITVNPTPANITGPGGECAGSSVSLSDADAGGTWSASNANVSVGSSGLVLGVTAGTAAISYTLPTTCFTTTIFTVDTLFVPSVTISTGVGDTVCVGQSVLLTAVGVNGGTSTYYKWFLNGNPAGIGPTFGLTPLNNDHIYAEFTSDLSCRSADTVVSSTVTISVDTVYLPIVHISASQGTDLLVGQADTFTATVMAGGPYLTYQWVRNSSVLSGETNNTYSGSSFANGDSISCMVTSTGPCGYASFNSVIVHVSAVGVNTPILTGTEVLLYPNPTSGGISIRADAAGVFYLYSIDGKTIAQYNINEGITGITLPSELATGMYMGKYIGNDGNTAQFKVVKE